MPKSLAKSQLRRFVGRISSELGLGVLWGAVAGALIGAGISLAIGLFYSSATALISIVIFGTSVLGMIFGHVIAKLLSDDIMMLTEHVRAAEFHGSLAIERVTHISSKKMQGKHSDSESKNTVHQPAKSLDHNRPSIDAATLLPYRSDNKVFELVVAAAARKAELGNSALAGL